MPDNQPGKTPNRRRFIIYVILIFATIAAGIIAWYGGESEITKVVGALALPVLIGLGEIVWRLLIGDSSTEAPPPEEKKKDK